MRVTTRKSGMKHEIALEVSPHRTIIGRGTEPIFAEADALAQLVMHVTGLEAESSYEKFYRFVMEGIDRTINAPTEASAEWLGKRLKLDVRMLVELSR